MPDIKILTDYAAKSLNNIYIPLYGLKMNHSYEQELNACHFNRGVAGTFYKTDIKAHYKFMQPENWTVEFKSI
ncbi:hypothetical protein FHS77_001031 [Paenochrobactrum gallinarii]|uniref:Uncharacterized protein n=1 Tax=Paenochrobactrum gallinarii TaxID=643673 RepID=A0A841LVH1_9HYPH|nr:hypothetical protein [Paenochrobactrum gallinarii]